MAGCELVVAIRNETSLGIFLLMFPMASSASSNNGVATRMEALLHTAMDRNSLLPRALYSCKPRILHFTT